MVRATDQPSVYAHAESMPLHGGLQKPKACGDTWQTMCLMSSCALQRNGVP